MTLDAATDDSNHGDDHGDDDDDDDDGDGDGDGDDDDGDGDGDGDDDDDDDDDEDDDDDDDDDDDIAAADDGGVDVADQGGRRWKKHVEVGIVFDDNGQAFV